MATNLDIFIKATDQATPALAKIGKAINRLETDATSLTTRGFSPAQAALTGFTTAVAEKGIEALGSVVRGAASGVASLISANNDLNAGLANVQSLGVAQEAIAGYRDDVQALSLITGKTTEDLTGGLYQVISAFGETSESTEILAINAKAAAAGLATTEDALALTSAVTKGYGDTTAEAVQHAADLAFEAVRLGQTTFPELARSIGQVVPVAQSLGVEQEELFAQYAALTGVTGSTSEVGTQLKNVYQQLLRPTSEMGDALSVVADQLDDQGKLISNEFTNNWKNNRAQMQLYSHAAYKASLVVEALTAAGQENTDEFKAAKKLYEENTARAEGFAEATSASAAALGSSIVQSVGATEAIQALTATADGNTNTIGKMFGSVEALNAALALSGSQSDDYASKLKEIEDATGAASKAFDAQTQGVNAAGFAIEQLKQVYSVAKEDAGAAVGTILSPLLEDAAKLTTTALPLVTKSLEENGPAIQSAIASWFTGGEKVGIADLITFDLDDSVSSNVNILDIFKFEKLTFSDFVDGSMTSVDLKGFFTFSKLAFDDVVDMNFDFGKGFIVFNKLTTEDIIEQELNIAGLFSKEFKVKADEVFEKTTYAKLFTTESTISADELFGSNKFSIGDLFSFETGFDVSKTFKKINISDIFSYENTIGASDLFGTLKWSVGDLFSFEKVMTFDDLFGSVKFSIGDLFSFETEFDPLKGFKKISIGDILTYETVVNPSEFLEKITISDMFDGVFDWKSLIGEARITLGDFIDFEIGFDFKKFNITKLTFNDIFDIGEFSLSSLFGGESLAPDLSNLGPIGMIEQPDWAIPFEPLPDEGPAWPAMPDNAPPWERIPDPDWGWDPVPRPTWGWPSIPEPGWLGRFINSMRNPTVPTATAQALGGDVRSTGIARFNEFGQEAVLRAGRVFYPQGDYAFLQRGDQVINNRQLEAGGMGGGAVTINMYNTISNNMDINTVARKVAEVIKGRA